MLEIKRQSVTAMQFDNPLQVVEYAARMCYASLDKIDPTKTADFVRNLVKRGHCTPLEHAYIRIYPNDIEDASVQTYVNGLLSFAAPGNYPLADRRLSRGVFYREEDERGPYVCGNLRDMSWWLGKHTDPLELMSSKAVILDPYYMVTDITTDRGIATEFFRHRTMAYDDDGYEQGYKSMAVEFVPEMAVNQQSTRYVNFNKKPTYIILQEPAEWAYNENCMAYSLWYNSCKKAIDTYNDMLQLGETPEFARSVLPLSLGTRVVLSGSITNWVYLLSLRLPKGAHPMARLLAAYIWESIKLNKVWYSKAVEFMSSGKLDGEFDVAAFDKESEALLTLVKERTRRSLQCKTQPMDSREKQSAPETEKPSTLVNASVETISKQ